MSNLLTVSNCDNIGNKRACLCMFLCFSSLTLVQEMRLEVSRKRIR